MSEAFQQDHPSHRMKVFTEHFFKNYSLQSEQRNRKASQNNRNWILQTQQMNPRLQYTYAININS